MLSLICAHCNICRDQDGDTHDFDENARHAPGSTSIIPGNGRNQGGKSMSIMNTQQSSREKANQSEQQRHLSTANADISRTSSSTYSTNTLSTSLESENITNVGINTVGSSANSNDTPGGAVGSSSGTNTNGLNLTSNNSGSLTLTTQSRDAK